MGPFSGTGKLVAAVSNVHKGVAHRTPAGLCLECALLVFRQRGWPSSVMAARVGSCKGVKEKYTHTCIYTPNKYVCVCVRIHTSIAVIDFKMEVPFSCNLGSGFVVRPQGLKTQFYSMCKVVSISFHFETAEG